MTIKTTFWTASSYFSKMKKMIFLLFGSLFLLSCNNSSLSKKLKGSDSLVISFNYPNTDSVVQTVNTTERKAIRRLLQFVDSKETEQYKCGYDGTMTFFIQGKLVLPVVFKYSEEGCRHFLFDEDNKLRSTKMSNEAADFLKSLAEGKNWY
jgi:hypothetical protein